MTDIVVMLGRNLIHWLSTKQTSLSSSMMEVEYIPLSNGVKKIIRLDMFLSEFELRDFITGFQIFYGN